MPDTSSPTGVVGDPRTDPRFLNGWKSSEVVAAASPIVWQPKTEDMLRKFPIWNQNGSSSCVAFAKSKQLAIEIHRQTGVWLDISPASIYQLRSNRPGLGMYIPDANDIVNKSGATLEALMKSQDLTEEQINAVKRTKVAGLIASALAEAVVNYLYVDVDIDKVAQVLEQKKAVSLLIFAELDEYVGDPQILHPGLLYADATVKHEVTAVDYYLHPSLGKVLWVEDSWGVGNGLGGRRNFTEVFLEKRCILADYLAAFDFEGGGAVKPSYDGTVMSLQKCLRYEGFFPADVDFTENFGPITRAGVVKFQLKYGISPALGNVGPITRAKLYQLYP
jgi:hypothetical protein